MTPVLLARKLFHSHISVRPIILAPILSDILSCSTLHSSLPFCVSSTFHLSPHSPSSAAIISSHPSLHPFISFFLTATFIYSFLRSIFSNLLIVWICNLSPCHSICLSIRSYHHPCHLLPPLLTIRSFICNFFRPSLVFLPYLAVF